MNRKQQKKNEDPDEFLAEVNAATILIEKLIPELPKPAARRLVFKATLAILARADMLLRDEPSFYLERWPDIKEAMRRAADAVELAKMRVQKNLVKQLLAAEAS